MRLLRQIMQLGCMRDSRPIVLMGTWTSCGAAGHTDQLPAHDGQHPALCYLGVALGTQSEGRARKVMQRGEGKMSCSSDRFLFAVLIYMISMRRLSAKYNLRKNSVVNAGV